MPLETGAPYFFKISLLDVVNIHKNNYNLSI